MARLDAERRRAKVAGAHKLPGRVPLARGQQVAGFFGLNRGLACTQLSGTGTRLRLLAARERPIRPLHVWQRGEASHLRHADGGTSAGKVGRSGNPSIFVFVRTGTNLIKVSLITRRKSIMERS